MVPNLGCHSDNFLVVPDDNLDNFLNDNHKVVTVTIRLTTVWQLFVLCALGLDRFTNGPLLDCDHKYVQSGPCLLVTKVGTCWQCVSERSIIDISDNFKEISPKKKYIFWYFVFTCRLTCVWWRKERRRVWKGGEKKKRKKRQNVGTGKDDLTSWWARSVSLSGWATCGAFHTSAIGTGEVGQGATYGASHISVSDWWFPLLCYR